MLKRSALMVLFVLALCVTMLSVTAGSAWAHGHTDVGIYELVIGFHNEPAYAGEPNGLDLFVTNTETEEPVNGLEETLRVEIIYGRSTRELTMRTQYGQEGAYTADILPTAAGDYTWHIWGDIEGTPVDVSMTSSPDTFSPMRTRADFSFPAAEPTAAELGQASQTALIVGIVGAVLGLAGLAVGFMGMRAARR